MRWVEVAPEQGAIARLLAKHRLPPEPATRRQTSVDPGQLHQETHLWNVLGWMERLAEPAIEQLGPLDCALGIQAAFIHDLGMVPSGTAIRKGPMARPQRYALQSAALATTLLALHCGGRGGGGTLTCNDSVQNGDETDEDCGGSCENRCPNTKVCQTGADCLSGYCDTTDHCASTCGNGAKDGKESDVDCGGGEAADSVTCPRCDDGVPCTEGSDCTSAYCAAGQCTPRPTQVAAGCGHSCARFDGGQLKCWGLNQGGKLGLGDIVARGDDPSEMGDHLPTVDLGTGRTAVAISPGSGHTCALLDNAQVKCWGQNDYGQLGFGVIGARGDDPSEMGDHLPAVDLGTGRTAVAVAAGSYHTCALLDNAQVKCWGESEYGRLGLGDRETRGDDPSEMGDDLPAVDLGTGRTAIAVAAGYYHTCALLDRGQVKCWGQNAYGQLGLGDSENRGDGSGEMSDDLPAVDLGTGRTAVAVWAGDVHTCALLDNAQVKCWGCNGVGQLGLGDGENRGDGSGEMGDDLPAVDLGTGRTAVAVSASYLHTCAVLDNGQVKCWGYNGEGELGLGDSEHRGDGSDETGDDLPAVDLGTGRTAFAISAGYYHTCALLENGQVKCWGYNGDSALGLGDIASRGERPGEMGDALPAVVLW
jgi:alpha-tubulin suppressor-like RCC1 family protein